MNDVITTTMTIHNYRTGEAIGTAEVTPDQYREYTANHGPEGVIRFESLVNSLYAMDYDLDPDHQDTRPSECVYLIS